MKLAFLRYNYRHFNHRSLPGFYEGDVLISERIDGLVTIMRSLLACDEEGDASIHAL